MKKLATILLAAAAMLAAGMSSARAAETKPLAALAVTSYHDLIDDINFVGGLVDRPQLGAAADGFVTLFTQGKGLTGVDKSRPFGAIIEANSDEQITGFVCIPITDFKAALGLLKLYNSVESENGVYKVTPKNGSNVAYLKQHGTWACFSDKAESLENIAADPLAVLKGLEKSYIVSGKIFLANVPDGLREKVLGPIRAGIDNEASTKKDDETDQDFAHRKQFIEQTEAYLGRVAGDLDQISLGWGLDRSAQNTFVDLSVTFKPGSKSAEETAAAAQAKTNFAGFRLPDAASIWSIASPIPAVKQEIAKSLIDFVRGKAMADIEKKTPENKRETAKQVVGDGLDLLAKIVKSGRIDAVGTGIVGANSATGIAAVYVADGELLDKILHTIVKAAEEDHPEISNFVKLDAETVEGHKVHKITIPIPENAENREKVVQYIGESLDIVIAVGKDNAYIAAGRDAGATLKKAAQASQEKGETSATPIAISYAIRPIVEAVSIVGKPHERSTAKLAATELEKTPGKDHVNFTIKPITNGAQARLEVEEGLMRLAGKMVILKNEGKLQEGE